MVCNSTSGKCRLYKLSENILIYFATNIWKVPPTFFMLLHFSPQLYGHKNWIIPSSENPKVHVLLSLFSKTNIKTSIRKNLNISNNLVHFLLQVNSNNANNAPASTIRLQSNRWELGWEFSSNSWNAVLSYNGGITTIFLGYINSFD